MAILLVTNDDGVDAAGLAALAGALDALGDVWVVAPDRPRSACGHGLTLDRTLRVQPVRDRWVAVDGTPADCVNAGVRQVLPERPALVVAGINHGRNLAEDVVYSGTVAGAREAALLGLPAIAVSLDGEDGFVAAAAVAAAVAARTLVEGLPQGVFLNVNVPAGPPRGVRVTTLGSRRYGAVAATTRTPDERTTYRQGGGPVEWLGGEESDVAAVAGGYVSVTPLGLDQTAHRAVGVLAPWGAALGGRLPSRPGAR